MVDSKLLSKLADVPLAKPGFDSLNLSAPVIVHMNPEGKWESCKPDMEEGTLKAIVQHLVDSKASAGVKSFCTQCASESKNVGGNMPNNYIPVIMMPIYKSDDCPFDMDSEIKKSKKPEKATKKKSKAKENKEEDSNTTPKKVKKRFIMQRLTDFDLLSQW